jgi:hypothetical protein
MTRTEWIELAGTSHSQECNLWEAEREWWSGTRKATSISIARRPRSALSAPWRGARMAARSGRRSCRSVGRTRS